MHLERLAGGGSVIFIPTTKAETQAVGAGRGGSVQERQERLLTGARDVGCVSRKGQTESEVICVGVTAVRITQQRQPLGELAGGSWEGAWRERRIQKEVLR